jgi:hypothetical protein
LTAQRNGRYDIVEGAGQHHSEGSLTIIRRVSAVERACSGIKANLAEDRGLQTLSQRRQIDVGGAQYPGLLRAQKIRMRNSL